MTNLPDNTHIEYVHLQVTDVSNALRFYQELLGFQLIGEANGSTMLSATGEPPGQIFLSALPGAIRKPSNTTGLYHVAIRLPSRAGLANLFSKLLREDTPFQGFSDHGVSEAIYLADPEGIGLELYVDRPRQDWPRSSGEPHMYSAPLDVDDLLSLASPRNNDTSTLPPETDIGHIHLHVAEIAASERFYHQLIGFEVTERSYPGALFLSAGGYHHHIGVNVWAGRGAPPAPSNAVGLVSFGLAIPDARAWWAAIQRLQETGHQVESWRSRDHKLGTLVRDPSQNAVVLSVRLDDLPEDIRELLSDEAAFA